MDNSRILLFAAFAFILLLLWQSWMEFYMPAPEQAVVNNQAVSAKQQGAGTASEGLPELSASDDVIATAEAGPLSTKVAQKSEKIIVETDVLRVEIDTLGGDVRVADLLNYPVSKENKDEIVRLLNEDESDYFVSQSGFLTSKGEAPNHTSLWQGEKNEYKLEEGRNSLEVPLFWQNSQGMQVKKLLRFSRGSYQIKQTLSVSNGSDQKWLGRHYSQLQRKRSEDKNKPSFVYTYLGGVVYNEIDGYEKIDFDDMLDEKLSRDTVGGWSAMIQHYFLAAWVPPADESNHFYTKAIKGDRYVIGSYGEAKQLAPGSSTEFETSLVVGPKLQHHLEEIATGLDLTVDYGQLTFLAKPVFWLLEKFHSLLGNWGWAIIFITLTIKAIFFKLSETSYRSMAKMRTVQPRLKVLKERYGDDKQRLNQEMMETYKKEKINPLGGCFPILVQIPVFISLYWVLVESVEMRQAPFMLWITDLSSKDPYFILPVVMGITMLIQQKLNPSPLDPIQQKVMMVLPIVFTVFFAFFPAGLVLYWVVNNTLSIAQQWVITRRIEAGAKK